MTTEQTATPTSNDFADAAIDAYVETALWSSMDESDDRGGDPMDANYSADDIRPDTLERMRRDIGSFLLANIADIESADVRTVKYDRIERAAHDFWLTRNGHGAGFWDGDWSDPQADRLTNAAKAFGEYNLYIGDDGKIHGYPA